MNQTIIPLPPSRVDVVVAEEGYDPSRLAAADLESAVYCQFHHSALYIKRIFRMEPTECNAHSSRVYKARALLLS